MSDDTPRAIDAPPRVPDPAEERQTVPVIDLNAVRERRQDDAFRSYVAAKNRADETLLVEDGLAAGRAWRAFLDTFMSPGQLHQLAEADRIVRGRLGRQ